MTASAVPAVTLILACLSCLPVRAAQEQQGDRGAGNAASLRNRLDLSIEHRTRYESLSNRFRLGEVGSDQQLPQRTRVKIGIDRIIDPVGFLIEFEDARIHLDDSASTVTNTMVNENEILQLHLKVALRRNPDLRNTLYFGRQSFDLGSRRLFARNRFRNTTNAFDGVRWTLGAGRWSLDAFLFHPVRRRLRQPDVTDQHTYFWGAYVAANLAAAFKNEFYYFGIRDSLTTPQSQKRRLSTIGARMFRDPRPGTLSCEFESAVQFGKRAIQDRLAHFQHVSADYSFDVPWRPMITGRYDYASGDRDPADHRDGTFDSLYGARRFEWGPTGIYGAWSRSNLSSPGWSLELNPTRKLMFAPAMRWFWLAQAKDQWVGTRLRDSTGRSGKYLGGQFELRLRYKFLKYFQPEVGYVRFFKGSYQERVPGSPGAGDSNYFYAEAALVFEHLLK